MELKRSAARASSDISRGSNRTFMELKLVRFAGNKFGEALRSNRTFMELKRLSEAS